MSNLLLTVRSSSGGGDGGNFPKRVPYFLRNMSQGAKFPGTAGTIEGNKRDNAHSCERRGK
jgi:hypothetical protein